MKKAAIYARVSTADQKVENQLLDLRNLAAQRGFDVVHGTATGESRDPNRGARVSIRSWRTLGKGSFLFCSSQLLTGLREARRTSWRSWTSCTN